MLTTHRKNLILERLRQDGQVIAKTFGAELGLSEDTIRRDLRELAAEGLLQRVHGGALPASPAVANFAAREQLNTSAKLWCLWTVAQPTPNWCATLHQTLRQRL
jgi:DeoR/GlpR family transcriptional regulator of sugar metabolism